MYLRYYFAVILCRATECIAYSWKCSFYCCIYGLRFKVKLPNLKIEEYHLIHSN